MPIIRNGLKAGKYIVFLLDSPLDGYKDSVIINGERFAAEYLSIGDLESVGITEADVNRFGMQFFIGSTVA